MKPCSGTLFLVFVALFAVSIRNVKSIEIKCRGETLKASEEELMQFKDCLTVVGAKAFTDLKADNAGCFSKCVMQKKELIDASGKPHKENILKTMDNRLPESIRGDLKTEMEKCLDEEGNKIDVNEASCSSFLPLAMCSHMAFIQVCKG